MLMNYWWKSALRCNVAKRVGRWLTTIYYVAVPLYRSRSLSIVALCSGSCQLCHRWWWCCGCWWWYWWWPSNLRSNAAHRDLLLNTTHTAIVYDHLMHNSALDKNITRRGGISADIATRTDPPSALLFHWIRFCFIITYVTISRIYQRTCWLFVLLKVQLNINARIRPRRRRDKSSVCLWCARRNRLFVPL